MKVTRLAVLAVALAAGGLAAMMATRMRAPAPAPVIVEKAEPLPTTEVLVAAVDIPIGNSLAAPDLSWQKWPKEAASGHFITRDLRPNALEELRGAIVRTPFYSGEPIREQKLVLGARSGFMSAILTAGMRAVSTEISPETGAGGFVLPNDKVDVILTKRDQGGERARQSFTSETILRNIRVLAIDQAIEEKNGQKVVVGRTATLELSPRQAEVLALSRQLGTLHLALRSLTEQELAGADTAESRSITLVRYGIVSQGR